MLQIKQMFKLSSLLFAISFIIAGCSSTMQTTGSNNSTGNFINFDTVKAGKFDTGKMWTFEYPPLQYFKEEYNFSPTDEWLNKVRMSALRFATYCSASFVSEDGLVMTNNHCARESIVEVQKEGENLVSNGFYASTLEEERLVPGLFVDQLVLIKDVTSEVTSEVNKGTTPQEKTRIERETIAKMVKEQGAATGLKIQITPLFNGAKYSLYGYKTYKTVKLVFTPEQQLGYFGGDYDNFTYPRYNLDCSFFRVYDDSGKPLKTENYFKWSKNGPAEGEAIFVVGNPGRTNRLKTVAQLEYMRDIQYPRTLDLLNGLVDVYAKLMVENPAKRDEMQNQMLTYTNSQKAYTGMLGGLRDPVLMAKKKDFEGKFKLAVHSNPTLNEKYGSLWDKIADTRAQVRGIGSELFALSIIPGRSSRYFVIAQDLVDLAGQMQLPESQRSPEYQGSELDSTIASIFPADFDRNEANDMLVVQLGMMKKYIGGSNKVYTDLTGGKGPKEAAQWLIENSQITSKEKVDALIKKGPAAILSSNDPFINFVIASEPRAMELQKTSSSILSEEEEYSKALGQALFEVYGTSIPPDATFTLRIADGVVKGYPYNGTIAPPFATFYGLYDRYYAFNGKEPFNLPQRWVNKPADFDLQVPFNFVATNDIIGGNSGSPVINKNAEVVGLAFDGNIESLPSDFIYTTEANRMVGVHSKGMNEALKSIYKAERLNNELINGKLPASK